MSFATYCQQTLPIELPAKPVVPAPCRWEIGTTYQISASEDCLDQSTYRLVLQAMRRARWFRLPSYEEIGRTIGYEWVVNKHPRYVGSWVKRYRKYLLDFYRCEELSDVDWGAVGSILGEARNGCLSVEFDDSLDWEDGDYGDSGSCFFNRDGCRHDVLERLREASIEACLVTQSNNGIARCLIQRRGSSYVVWNAYGFTGQKFARILSTWHGCSYEKVSINNNGTTDGQVWVNSGSGWIVGSPDRIEPGTIDLDIECDDEPTCHACGGEISQDDATEWNGETYCSECLTHCDHCDDYCLSEDSCSVHNGRYHETWCTDCANDDAMQCPCCDEMIETS